MEGDREEHGVVLETVKQARRKRGKQICAKKEGGKGKGEVGEIARELGGRMRTKEETRKGWTRDWRKR